MRSIDTLAAPGGQWLNPPDDYALNAQALRLTTDAETDFWQQTYYGFRHHSGHAFGFFLSEDFTVQVKVAAAFSHLYDQAGIVVLEDETHWVKAGIEYNDAKPAIGSVVTRGTSDWSTGCFPGDPGNFWMRATLADDALRLQYSTDGATWPLLRLCPWPSGRRYFVGVMACTPQRAGLAVTFSHFYLGAPLNKPLHDLS
ncbi:DUF1349 domain-containing protein [Pantoea eucrina]|uniref:DUF1349 domain-containing protein n=1 Tax=Pantoea eucrina TaxID=472693 RepID=A0ABU5LKD3_9GAMM|nr:DUF1349 domain-containing protein [Pantoea eucrina]MDZ7280176.1 DUF1349 domain-containing protein [Pantoea eucrina]